MLQSYYVVVFCKCIRHSNVAYQIKAFVLTTSYFYSIKKLSLKLCLLKKLFLLKKISIAALLGARFRSNDSCLNPDDGIDGNGPLDIPAGCNMGRRRSRAVLYQLSGHYVRIKFITADAIINNKNLFIILFITCKFVHVLKSETGENQD